MEEYGVEGIGCIYNLVTYAFPIADKLKEKGSYDHKLLVHEIIRHTQTLREHRPELNPDQIGEKLKEHYLGEKKDVSS